LGYKRPDGGRSKQQKRLTNALIIRVSERTPGSVQTQGGLTEEKNEGMREKRTRRDHKNNGAGKYRKGGGRVEQPPQLFLP